GASRHTSDLPGRRMLTHILCPCLITLLQSTHCPACVDVYQSPWSLGNRISTPGNLRKPPSRPDSAQSPYSGVTAGSAFMHASNVIRQPRPIARPCCTHKYRRSYSWDGGADSKQWATADNGDRGRGGPGWKSPSRRVCLAAMRGKRPPVR